MRLRVRNIDCSALGSKGASVAAAAPVSCVAWTAAGDVLSVGDDQQALLWARDGTAKGPAPWCLFPGCDAVLRGNELVSPETQGAHDVAPAIGSLATEPNVFVYYTAIAALALGGSDLLALGTADGRIVLCARVSPRPEKTFDAHRGAVLALAWSTDASTLLSGGEDGTVKIFSRAGMLRSVLLQQTAPAYDACWIHNSNHVLVACANTLHIASLQSVCGLNTSAKCNKWIAHDSAIVKVAWSSTSNLIVSTAEDRRFKVWDVFGRLIFASPAMEHVATALSWSPLGDSFALGCYSSIRVCDKLGWTQTIADNDASQCGSIYSLAWSPDGTCLAAGTAKGRLVFAHLLQRRISWLRAEVVLEDELHVLVRDAVSGTEERYDFKDSIVTAAVSHNVAVFLTFHQAHIATLQSLGSQSLYERQSGMYTFDLPTKHGRVSALCLARSRFAVLDLSAGVFVYAYSGSLCATIRVPRADALTSSNLVALSDDAVVLRDPQKDTQLSVYDPQTGILLAQLRHTSAVLQVTLSQCGATPLLGIIDSNADLFLAPLPLVSTTSPLSASEKSVSNSNANTPFIKISTMVSSAAFAEDSQVLCAIADSSVVYWFCPEAFLVDPDLASLSRVVGFQDPRSPLLSGGPGNTASSIPSVIVPSSFSSNKSTSVDTASEAKIQWFSGTQCGIRRSDGTLYVTSPGAIYLRVLKLRTLALSKRWDSCLRLCRDASLPESTVISTNTASVTSQVIGAADILALRSANSTPITTGASSKSIVVSTKAGMIPLWATLAVLALAGGDVDTAEVAYAAVGAVDRVQSLCRLRETRAGALRTAALLGLQRRLSEAETVLLAGGFTYAAVRLWLDAHQWERALDVAQRSPDLIPVVLSARAAYLRRFGLSETNKRVLALPPVVVDRESVAQIIDREERKLKAGS